MMRCFTRGSFKSARRQAEAQRAQIEQNSLHGTYDVEWRKLQAMLDEHKLQKEIRQFNQRLVANRDEERERAKQRWAEARRENRIKRQKLGVT